MCLVACHQGTPCPVWPEACGQDAGVAGGGGVGCSRVKGGRGCDPTRSGQSWAPLECSLLPAPGGGSP